MRGPFLPQKPYKLFCLFRDFVFFAHNDATVRLFYILTYMSESLKIGSMSKILLNPPEPLVYFKEKMVKVTPKSEKEFLFF